MSNHQNPNPQLLTKKYLYATLKNRSLTFLVQAKRQAQKKGVNGANTSLAIWTRLPCEWGTRLAQCQASFVSLAKQRALGEMY